MDIKNSNIKENYTADIKCLKNFLPHDFEFTPIEQAVEELIRWYDQYLGALNEEAVSTIMNEV